MPKYPRNNQALQGKQYPAAAYERGMENLTSQERGIRRGLCTGAGRIHHRRILLSSLGRDKMQSMFSHNATSRAWEQLIELTDRVAELRRKYGDVQMFSDSTKERRLVIREYTLRFERRDEEKEIAVSIVNDSLAKRKVPKERTFTVESDADNPWLSERGSDEQGNVADVFDRVMQWFLGVVPSHS
jgi:hypothetical protein